MVDGKTRRARLSMAILLIAIGAGCFPLLESGCSGNGSGAKSDAAIDASEASAQDSSVTDASTVTVDARTDAFDADDVDPPFDCTQDAAAGVAPPNDLRCTGLYDRWTKKTIAATAFEYKPAYTLWSDGADKRRWISLPAGSKIDTTFMDGWAFPIGTKFWKEFAFSGAPVETRYYQKIGDNSWIWTTYVWSADMSAAIKNDDGVGADAGGDASYDGYEVPDHAKCDTCHQGGSDSILGFEAVLLGAPGATGLTLDQLKQKSLLTVNPPQTTVTIPNELTSKDAKALGWLHANCGVSCHNVNGSCQFKAHMKIHYSDLVHADGGTDLVTDLDTYTTTYKMAAAFPAGLNRITPGDPTTSAISVLASQRNAITPQQNQMPWIDSHKVDTTDVADLNAWITALP
jgi:hypothetical protein